MGKKIITRLEELVEMISENYSSIPIEIVNELNELTKNKWGENEYIEYCAEYWSRSTLEETVYALLHCGEYPENIEEQIFLWKNTEKIGLTDKEIMFKLRDLPQIVDEDIICKFADLPIREFYDWINSYFYDWSKDREIDKDDIQSGSFKVIFNYDNIEEYAKYKYVILKTYGRKMISLDCCNLYESEKNDIISFANNYRLYLYKK